MTPAEHSATEPAADWSTGLPTAAREVEEFLSEAGWDQPPLLFALVPTARLLEAEPALAERLPAGAGLTPVAQDPLDTPDLAAMLEEIYWPPEVAGCALAQEIVVLPPGAEDELDRAVTGSVESGATEDDLTEVAVRVARGHPDRRDARLVVAVSRAGGHCCLLRLRGAGDEPDELVEHPDLAPNMVSALLRTLDGTLDPD
jgi:hypothetical protein